MLTSSVRRRTRQALCLACGGLAFAALSTAQGAVYLAGADAEIRESQPERTRGFGGDAASGQSAELQLSQINSNRNLALIRFALPAGTTAADLQNYASLRTYFRASSNFGTTGGSVRLYGLNPTNALNATWNENEVMYRDAGTHQNTTPAIGTGQSEPGPSPISQPGVGTPAGGDPPAPIASVSGYGADPNHARRAPGLVHNDAPFSQQIENENAARFTYNQAQRTAFLAAQPFQPYLPYINQPGYGIRSTTTSAVGNAISTGDGDPNTTGDGYADIYSDVPETNRPWDAGATDSWVDDLGPDYSFIGYSLVQGTSAAGNYISFGDTDGFDVTPAAHEATIQQNLLNFLTQGLNGGQTTFTFVLGRGLGTLDFDGDTVFDDVVSGAAVHLASKELIPAGGLAGDYSAQLVVAPEPSSLALLGLGAVGLLRRRARKDVGR